MSTNESYEVAAKLMMKSNVGESLPGIIRDFETLDKILNQSRESLAKMAAGYDKMSSAAVAAADKASRATTEGAERSARAQEAAAERASRAQESAAQRVAVAQESAAQRASQSQERAAEREVAAATRAAATAERIAQRRSDTVYNAAKRENDIRDRQAASMQRSEAEHENRARDRAGRAATRRPEHGGVNSMDVNMAASETASGGRELLTLGAHAALEVAQTMSMLQTDRRVTPDIAHEVYEAAWKATQTGNGTTMGKNLEAALDLKNVTGSVDDAIKILPQFTQLAAVLAAVDKKNGGSGDQAFAAAKAMEILGQLTQEVRNPQTGRMEPQINAEQLPEHLMAYARIAAATNGRVDAKAMLAFAKTSRVGGMQLSTEFLEEKLPAIILALGPEKSGTAIQSISQVFQGGKLTDKSRAAMEELRLGGDSHEVTTGTGRNKKSHMVGKVFEQDLLSSDPAAWAAKVHDHLINDLHMSEMEAMNKVQGMAQRNTIAGMLADMMKDAAGILKEQQNIHNTFRPNTDGRRDRDSYGTDNPIAAFMSDNPQARINKLHDAFENLMTALTGPALDPALKLMDSLTVQLNALGQWAHENPDIAKRVTEVVAAGTAIAGALAAVSGAMMIYGPLIRAARAAAGLGEVAATVAATAAPVIATAAEAAAVSPAVLAVAAGAVGYVTYKALTTPLDVNDARAQDLAKSRASAKSVSAFGEPVDGIEGYGASVAPKASDLAAAANKGPVPVQVVNPGDIARGTVGSMARQANRPDNGVGGFDATGSVQSHVNTGLQ